MALTSELPFEKNLGMIKWFSAFKEEFVPVKILHYIKNKAPFYHFMFISAQGEEGTSKNTWDSDPAQLSVSPRLE